MQAYTAPRPSDTSFSSYESLADAQAWADAKADAQRYPAHHDDADHTDYSPLPLERLYTPRPGAPVRYARYDAFEGYASVTEEWTLLFRTSGSLWFPVMDQSNCVILGLVGEAEAQLALDRCAGGYGAVCTSRRQMEV